MKKEKKKVSLSLSSRLSVNTSSTTVSLFPVPRKCPGRVARLPGRMTISFCAGSEVRVDMGEVRAKGAARGTWYQMLQKKPWLTGSDHIILLHIQVLERGGDRKGRSL